MTLHPLLLRGHAALAACMQVRRGCTEVVPLMTLPHDSPAARQLPLLLLAKARDK